MHSHYGSFQKVVVWPLYDLVLDLQMKGQDIDGLRAKLIA